MRRTSILIKLILINIFIGTIQVDAGIGSTIARGCTRTEVPVRPPDPPVPPVPKTKDVPVPKPPTQDVPVSKPPGEPTKPQTDPLFRGVSFPINSEKSEGKYQVTFVRKLDGPIARQAGRNFLESPVDKVKFVALVPETVSDLKAMKGSYFSDEQKLLEDLNAERRAFAENEDCSTMAPSADELLGLVESSDANPFVLITHVVRKEGRDYVPVASGSPVLLDELHKRGQCLIVCCDLDAGKQGELNIIEALEAAKEATKSLSQGEIKTVGDLGLLIDSFIKEQRIVGTRLELAVNLAKVGFGMTASAGVVSFASGEDK